MKQTRINDMEIYTINQDPYMPLHPRLGNKFICNITEVIYRHPVNENEQDQTISYKLTPIQSNTATLQTRQGLP
jgi:ABC-type microcin C transport system duplicated ATPase subunit YejF